MLKKNHFVTEFVLISNKPTQNKEYLPFIHKLHWWCNG